MGKGFYGFVFDNWGEWLDYTMNSLTAFFISLISILFAISGGLIMLVEIAFKKIKRFVIKYPIPVLAAICIILVVCVLMMFVSYSAKLQTCQIERDSVLYEKKKLEQAFIGDTIIVRGYRTRDLVPSSIDE